MEELIKTFHIEINLLIAQFVNFAIVLLILYKFAYKPILKALNKRTEKIEKGLKDSEEASKKLKEMEEKEKDVLKKAKTQAREIIKNSEDAAVKNAAIITDQTEIQAKKMLADAKKQIEQEKEKIITEAKSEIAGLVMAATEKIIGEKMNSEKDEELIKKAIK